MAEPAHPALERILRDRQNQAAFGAMTNGLSGADLTTLLMAVFAARADDLNAADLMRQYQQDRFVAPTPVDVLTLARIELAALEIAAPEFAPVGLAPVAPLGTHLALGSVPQNNVLSTARLNEVAADPTNSLALEAAIRRAEILKSKPRSNRAVQLAAVHRVARAQHFDGSRSFAHFALMGLVSAGRDQGNYWFEERSLSAQLRTLISIVRSVTTAAIRIRLTAFTNALGPTCDAVASGLTADTSLGDVSCEQWPEREHGRGYYRNICFKLYVIAGDEEFEIGDGGDVWWTQHLLQSRKERLFIGGLGLERLAMLVAEQGGPSTEPPS